LNQKEFGTRKHAALAIYYLLLGMAQKVIFANWLGTIFVNTAFQYPETQTTITTTAAVLAYSLQIFLDFSGYTLIVAGLGMLLGFILPINFRQPYLSVNLKEFWRRWHISLSTFIRDNVYIPLGGNRHGFIRAQINILLAMLISGLWHGANATFLVWGALHGFGVIVQNVYEKWVGIKLPSLIAQSMTFSFICLGWIFFRADTSDTAWKMISGFGRYSSEFSVQHLYLLIFIVIFFILSAHKFYLEQRMVHLIRLCHGWKLTTVITLMIFLVIFFGPKGIPEFIYYRF
jgi:D-alanyl-lipoteichoic acid acyltransferase DltB (MBOAT superfamily)